MGNTFSGLAIGQPLGIWVAGIVVAAAYLTRGGSVVRIGVLIAAVLWPALPALMALADRHAAQQAAEAFTVRCDLGASEKVIRRAGSVADIFVETSRVPMSDPAKDVGREIVSRLTAETPGFNTIHEVGKDASGAQSITKVWHRGGPSWAGAELSTMQQKDMPRLGVRVEAQGAEKNHPLRNITLTIYDRVTNDVLAMQRNVIYRQDAVMVGYFPLWRGQTRLCPMTHPADFIRSVLGPAGE